MNKSNFGLWIRNLARVLQENINESVAQFEKIVRLPVVAHSFCEERVENRLPRRKRSGSDHICKGLPKCAQRFSDAFTLADLARVTHCEGKDLLAVPFTGKEGKRRRFPHDKPTGEFFGSIPDEIAIETENVLRSIQRMYDEPGEHLGPDF